MFNQKKNLRVACEIFYRPQYITDEIILKWCAEDNMLIKPIFMNELSQAYNYDKLKKLYQGSKKNAKSLLLYFDGEETKYKKLNRYHEGFKVMNGVPYGFNTIEIDSHFLFYKNAETKIKWYLNFSGFLYASFYDYDFVLQQSETNPERVRFPWLRKMTRNVANEKKLDISNNPGRRSVLKDFVYVGASKFWFGSEFFKLYDKEKILAFDQATKVEEWDNGIVHVHLYEGIFDGAKRGNQKRQQAFRDLLEIEKRKIK